VAGPTPRPGPACRERPGRCVADGRRTHGHPGHPGSPRSPVSLGQVAQLPLRSCRAGPAYALERRLYNRTPVVGWGSFAPPEVVGMSQPADLPPHRRPPYSRHAKLIAGHVLTLERRHTYVCRHTRPGARRSTLDPWIRLASSAGMGSETAVRRRLTGEETIAVYYRRVFPQLKASVVGLAGLEPAASSLSAIGGSPLCGAAFSQVAADRQGRSNAF
jgi:hypothetical protein